MLKEKEARQRVLKEWDAWIRTNPASRERPTGVDGLMFFRHLSKEQPGLLEFRPPGDRWQVIHGWLLHAEKIRD